MVDASSAMRQLLTEKRSPCWIDFTRLEEGKGSVTELSDGRFRVRAKGQHCGVLNRNNRKYPPPVWERHCRPSAEFYERVRARRVIGHLEHPDDGKSRMGLGSIVVTEVSKPDPNGEVWITFETMSTPGGKVVEAYIRDRVGFGLSSRGNGSVVNHNGVDEVQDDFEPVSFDCVIDESTPGAEVYARRLKESVDALLEATGGDVEQARLLDERLVVEALARDRALVEQQQEESSFVTPPNTPSRFIAVGKDDTNYRAYGSASGTSWDVWAHPRGGHPVCVGSGLVEGEIHPTVQQHILRESWWVADSLPYSGTLLNVKTTSADETKKARKIVQDAGFHVNEKDDTSFCVYTSYEDGEQAKAHLHRLLSNKGIEMKAEAVGLISRGRLIQAEDVMLAEAGNTSKQPGRMAGGDTTPEASMEMPDDISPEYRGHDPEDLDLDLDVNEADMDEQDFSVEPDYDEFEFEQFEEPYDDEYEMEQDDSDEYSDEYEMEQEYDDAEYDDAEYDDAEYDDAEYDDAEYDDEYVEGASCEACEASTCEGCPSESIAYSRVMDRVRDGGNVGKVRVWFNEGDEPVRFEYYGADGFLESITDAKGNMLHEAAYSKAAQKTISSKMRKQYKEDPGHKERTVSQKKAVAIGAARAKGQKVPPPPKGKGKGESIGESRVINGVLHRFNERGQLLEAVAPNGIVLFQEVGQGKYSKAAGSDPKLRKTAFKMVQQRRQEKAGVRARQKVKAAGGGRKAQFQAGQAARAKVGVRRQSEAWYDADGNEYLPEQELTARHGGGTGIATKSREYMGDPKPQYSKKTPFRGDGDEIGDGGDAPDLEGSVEGEAGRHLKKGTMHKGESFGGDDYSILRERVAFLEDEIANLEDVCVQQRETIDSLRETILDETLKRERAELIVSYPELAIAGDRLERCESVEDLHAEVRSLLRLVESTRPSREEPRVLPSSNTTTMTTEGMNGAPRVISESQPPGRMKTGPKAVQLSEGTTASRVAAHRRRRRRG